MVDDLWGRGTVDGGDDGCRPTVERVGVWLWHTARVSTRRVSALDRAAIDRDGQVVVRGLLDAETVARFRSLVRAAVGAAERLELPPGNEVYQAAFDQYMNLWRIDDAVREITLHPQLAGAARELLGVDAVRVYHDQALVKLAGGGHTPWHQDQWYWPLDTDRTITMWLPLHDVEPDMGDLEFALGTHGGAIGDEPIGDAADAVYERHVRAEGIERRRTGPMRAGDASFHLGWTLHRAHPNVTDRDRHVMTVIWFADGTRITEPDNQGRREDLVRWLPGLAPGDLAASDLNPLAG